MTQRSPSMVLSVTNIDDWRSVAAAADDIMAVLDSCSLKHGRRLVHSSRKRIGSIERKYVRFRKVYCD